MTLPYSPSSVLPPNAPRAWLEQFPAQHRSAIANWFHFSVRSGIFLPAAVLAAVESTIRRRLAWSPTPASDWRYEVLKALHEGRAGAMAYAQSVINYEELPHAQRQKVKAERTVAALKEAMKAKTVTDPQRAYLRALGYTGGGACRPGSRQPTH